MYNIIYGMKQLTKENIIKRFRGKPIFIVTTDSKGMSGHWYICTNVNATCPEYLLSDEDESNDGIEIINEPEYNYCLWEDFNKLWKAYGFVEV